jgi:DNA polymerase/3'-5' exonuclease PolX
LKFHFAGASGSAWVDLYITDPKHFGLVYLIRTGSADFNKKWISALYAKHPNYKVSDGNLFKTENNYTTPIDIEEESDIFKMIGWDYIEPEDRR